jgi:hypothetical protein
LPAAWGVFGVFEGFLIGLKERRFFAFEHLFIHFVFSVLRYYSGFVVTLFLHLLYNSWVGNPLNLLWYLMRERCRGRHWIPQLPARFMRGGLLLCRRRPALFSAMPYCLGLTKYRKTGRTNATSPIGFEEILAANKQLAKSMKKKSRSNQSSKKRVAMEGCALGCFNPFLPSCQGCKIPDSYALPTAPIIVRGETAFQNDTVFTTGSWLAFTPVPSIGRLNPASQSAGGVPTWTGGSGTAVTGYSNWSGQIATWRLVCGGLRLSCEQAITTASGHVNVAHIPSNFNLDALGLSALPTSFSALIDRDEVMRVPIAELATKPLIIPFRRNDQQSFEFHAIAYPEGKEDADPGFSYIVLAMEGTAGGSAATVISVEYIYHFEVTLSQTGASTLFAFESMPEPYNPMGLAQLSVASMAAPPATPDNGQGEGSWIASAVRSVKEFLNRNESSIVSGASAIYEIGSTIMSAFPMLL